MKVSNRKGALKLVMQDLWIKEAMQMKEEIVRIRRHLHENPELELDLEHTRNFVEAKLREFGYTDIQHVGKAGLTATVGAGNGNVFLLRADMDALPIAEENDLPFQSKNACKMHACGHDMHTSMLLAAANILKRHESEIPGTVKLMFQPGEETLNGCMDMIEHGVLENPRPDAAAMIHVMPGVPMEIGSVMVVGGGPAMASSDWFHITVKGKGGHGSMPYLAVDPLVPLNMIQNALHTLQSRELPPNALVALTVGKIEGGETANVISETVGMWGTLRTYHEKQRQYIKERMVQLTENIAKAFRCEGSIEFPVGVPCFKVDELLSDHMQAAIPACLGSEKYVPPMKSDIPSMGSEDFACISHKLPTGLMWIAASDSRKGGDCGLHNPKLVLDEDCLPYGAAAYAGVAVSWLEANR